MENNQKEIKNYWNILKEELGKNKRVFFLLFLFTIIFALVFLWTAPASSSVMERLIMAAPFLVPFILLILFVLSIVIVNRRKYENFIVGKNPWEIAEINFRRYAIVSPVMILALAIIDFWDSSLRSRFSDFDSSMNLLTGVVVCVIASILFLVIASLFKRKSSKAIAVGYTCLLPLLILAVYLFFNSFFDYNHVSIDYQLWLFLSFILIQGILDVYRASKHTVDIKRDSELQKEIIKIKEEEK